MTNKLHASTNYGDDGIVEQYGAGTLIHEYVEQPEALRLLDPIKGKNILDLGCADGGFAGRLAKLGAIPVGIDISESFLNKARVKFPDIKFLNANGVKMDSFQDRSFDKIIMRMVLVNITNIADVKGVFSECSRILKSGGVLVFSIPHPLTVRRYKDSLAEVILPENGGYYQDGMIYKIKVPLDEGNKFMEFSNCHWSLGILIKELAANNLYLTEITTPIPPKNEFTKHFNDLYENPHHMFLKCVKLLVS